MTVKPKIVKIGKITYTEIKEEITANKTYNFKKGDKIVMNNGADQYRYTKPGIKGVVKSNSQGGIYFVVQFPSLQQIFDIHGTYMEYIDGRKKSSTKTRYNILYKSSDGVSFHKTDGIKTGCSYRTIDEQKSRIKDFKKEIKDVEMLIKVHKKLFNTK